MKDLCWVCSSGTFAPLIDFGRQVKTGVLLRDPNDRVANHSVSFSYCLGCGFVRRDADHATDGVGDYSNVGRATGRQLPAYSAMIVERLISKVDPRDLVVEVGANDGTFLSFLRDRGFSNLLAVEPSASCTERLMASGHRVESIHFGREAGVALRERYGYAAAVVCRHTLEHVPDPSDFIAGLFEVLRVDGTFVVEVPDSTQIFPELLAHELWDEHLSFFGPAHLRRSLMQGHLVPESVEILPSREAKNILAMGTKVARQVISTQQPLAADHSLYSTFSSRWGDFSKALRARIPQSNAPIVSIGASHLQSNFLRYSGLGELVSFCVDDDPTKAGLFLPVPQPVPIVTTAQFLAERSPRTLLLTAFGYPSWTERLIQGAGGGSTAIDPYSLDP